MLEKRKRSKATQRVNQKEYPKLTLKQALDLFVARKRAEGVSGRTLKDWGYFEKWWRQNLEEIKTIGEITTEMIRNYINNMKYDAKKYDGHKFIDANKYGKNRI